jgi:c-di-AMP phosphodiesterase-like protein
VRDFLYVVVIIILFYILTPFVVLIPGIGISLAAAIPVILLALVIIFLYDAARLIYDEIAKGVNKVTEKVASVVEESEKKSKK